MGLGRRIGTCMMLVAITAGAQDEWELGLSDPDPNKRIKVVRSLSTSPDGFRNFELLAPLLQDESEDVRAAAVNGLIRLRLIDAQPLLIDATADLSPRVQALAVDGLVDFFVPDYVQFGRLASIKGFADGLKRRFSKPTPLIVPPYVSPSPEAVLAIGAVARSGRSTDARANAARAIGILRGHQALDDLLEGVRSKQSTLIRESVLAMKKLEDPSVGPDIVFLLRDPDPSVREAVIQTVGQLQTQEAVPGLARIVEEDQRQNLRAEALVALAKIPENGQRRLFLRHLASKSKGMRSGAAEGLGRLNEGDDLELVKSHLSSEQSLAVKLSLAFAAVTMGDLTAIDVLVDGLNSTAHRMVARPFLIETSRNPEVLDRLYVPLRSGSGPQRRHLAHVIAMSGTEESVSHLQALTQDSNDEVATAAIEALRSLRSRL